jgi:hypothetical protein
MCSAPTVPAARPRFARTPLTPSGDLECLLEPEDERLRASCMNVLSHCCERDRGFPPRGLSWGSIGVGGVSVIDGAQGACLGTMIAKMAKRRTLNCEE